MSTSVITPSEEQLTKVTFQAVLARSVQQKYDWLASAVECQACYHDGLTDDAAILPPLPD